MCGSFLPVLEPAEQADRIKSGVKRERNAGSVRPIISKPAESGGSAVLMTGAALALTS